MKRAFAAAVAVALVAVVGCGSDSSESPAPEGVEAPSWAYSGENGPDRWGELSDEYGLCETGERQSPINIAGARPGKFPRIRTDYEPESVTVVDSGHAVEVEIDHPDSSISLGGRKYELVQFHFHMPSEELVDGRRFPATVHLVHISEDGSIAVLGVLIRAGQATPGVAFDIPDEEGEESGLEGTVDPNDLLPANRRGFRYIGSLTTPPCTEGVIWTVMQQPISMSPDQLGKIREAHHGNARPIKPIEDRRILVGPALARGQ